jgi:hypothetical protein
MTLVIVAVVAAGRLSAASLGPCPCDPPDALPPHWLVAAPLALAPAPADWMTHVMLLPLLLLAMMMFPLDVAQG